MSLAIIFILILKVYIPVNTLMYISKLANVYTFTGKEI